MKAAAPHDAPSASGNVAASADGTRSVGLAVLAIVCAMAIFAGNFVISRHGTTGSLTAFDLAALRFGVAGSVLGIIAMRDRGRVFVEIGWWRCLALACLAGAPYMLLIFWGVTFIEAARAATINAGIVPVATAVGALLVFGTRITLAKIGAFVVILGGLGLLTGFFVSSEPRILIGDTLLALSGVSWAAFYLCIKAWKLPSMAVTTAVAVVSLVFYLPVYVLLLDPQILAAPATDVLVQAVNQGLMTAFLALFLVSYGIARIGAAATGLFAPLVPLFALLFSIPVLGELPTALQLVGVVLVVVGMLAAFFADRRPAAVPTPNNMVR